MPAQFVPFAKTAVFYLIFQQYGQRVMNTLWLRRTDAATVWEPSDLEEVAVLLGEWWLTELAPITSNTVELTNVIGTDMTEQNSYTVNQAFSSHVGSSAAEALSMGTTYTTTFNTGLAGRSFRGRNYFVGMVDNQTVTTNRNNVTTAFAAAILAAYGEMSSYFNQATFNSEHVVASRQINGVVRTTGVCTPVIGYYHADFFVDSRRPRLSGRGS